MPIVMLTASDEDEILFLALESGADGYLLNCQILWESGDRAGALAELDAALAAYPAGIRLLEMKAYWLKESGELARAKDCLDLLAISTPDKPGPLIQSLYLLPGEANRAARAPAIGRCTGSSPRGKARS